MFAIRKVLPQVGRAALVPARNMTAVSGPPKVRISFGEKIAHGIVMSIGYLFIPVWVLRHINEYKGH